MGTRPARQIRFVYIGMTLIRAGGGFVKEDICAAFPIVRSRFASDVECTYKSLACGSFGLYGSV